MLDIQGLQFAWPGAGPCIAIDRLHVAAGETLFLYGPSGCGKSTLLGLMAGVLQAGSGHAALLGRPWSALKPGARDARRADHVGVIFQQFNLLPYLSLLDNVLLPTRFSHARAKRCAPTPLAAAQTLLRHMGLDEALWPRRADALSVGQQQRVAAARALLGQPELVIADEPTSALDADARASFMDLLMGECKAAGSTLVFVSHDERLAERFDQRLSLPTLNRALATVP